MTNPERVRPSTIERIERALLLLAYCIELDGLHSLRIRFAVTPRSQPDPSLAMRRWEPPSGRLPPRRHVTTLEIKSSSFLSSLAAASIRGLFSSITIREDGLT
jgi:hypothetical protein